MKKGLLLCAIAALLVGCVSRKTYRKDRKDFFSNDKMLGTMVERLTEAAEILDARDKKMSPAIEALDRRLKVLEGAESK